MVGVHKPGAPDANTVLDVPNYNFHYQRSYNLAHPIHVTRGGAGPDHLYL